MSEAQSQPEPEDTWLNENLGDGFRYAISSNQLLCQRQSLHQQIEIHDTASFGHLLRIDGSFMASEKDEFFYHENLVHVPACTHRRPESVLILGGGDGGSAEEILKHNTVRSVKLVEIDQAVLDLSRPYLRGVHHGVIDEEGGDPRLEIFVADGLEYVRSSLVLYDLLILDLTDPSGPSQPPYNADFYLHCAARLKPGGLLSLQVASPFSQPERVVRTLMGLNAAFRVVRPYMVSMPLAGGQWMMACASQGPDPAAMSVGQVDTAIRSRRLQQLQHYNGHTHQAAMALPNFVRDMVMPTGARWIP